MAEAFDPYRKWLGIPQDEQPPHHYRLLGIASYEDDPDVIENAADRQMAHVRTYQNGKHAALSQKILNELAAAKLTLLQEAKKAAYDESLREAEAPPAPPEEPTPPPEEIAEADEADDELASISGIGSRPPVRGRGVATVGPKPKVSVVKAPKASQLPTAPVASSANGSVLRSRRKKNSPLLFILSGVGLLFAVILVVFFVAMQSGPEPDRVTEGDPNQQVEDNGTRGPRPFETPQNNDDPPNPNPNPGGSDFPEVGSESPSDPIGPRLQNFDEQLAAAREAISQREKEKTLEHMQEARRRARSRGERAQLAHLEAINSYVEQFWQDVFLGVRKLDRLDDDDEGRLFPIEDAEYEFITLNRGRVTLKIDGTEQSWKLRELPVREAFYFSNIGRRDQHASQVFQAAFLLLDGERENDLSLEDRRKLARLLYQLAAPTQGRNDFLDRELEEAGLEPIAYVPAEDSTPTRPRDDDEPSEEETAGDDPDTEEEDPELAGDPDEEPGDGEPGDDEPSEDEPSEEELVEEEDTRWELPVGADLSTASDRVAQELRGDISSARTPEAKAELVRRLLLTANQEKDDPALRYAYLERARDVARGMGHSELLVAVITEIGKSYRVDTLDELVQAMRTCGTNIESPDSFEMFVDQTCDLCLVAIAEDRPEILAQLSDNLNNTASRVRVAPLRAQATGQWFQQYSAILAQVEDARATLEENPEDPAANQLLGTYLCFFKGNWKEGLPLLAKAENHTLRELAADDEDPPSDTNDRIALGDRWLQLAQHGEVGSAIAHSMVRHAIGHYNAVVNKLGRREKLEMQQKIRSLRGILDSESAYMPRT